MPRFIANCVVPEKIHTHPMEGHWKFLGGEGVLKAKFLEEMYENKLEFPGGVGGAKQKTFRGGEYGYFLELHIRSCFYVTCPRLAPTDGRYLA